MIIAVIMAVRCAELFESKSEAIYGDNIHIGTHQMKINKTPTRNLVGDNSTDSIFVVCTIKLQSVDDN